jgi:serine protease inhibitor
MKEVVLHLMSVFSFTAFRFLLGCAPVSQQRQFIANHPFVFVIKNIELGIVLFAGRLSHA